MPENHLIEIMTKLAEIATEQKGTNRWMESLAKEVQALPCPHHMEMLGRLDERIGSLANAVAANTAAARETGIKAADHAKSNADDSTVQSEQARMSRRLIGLVVGGLTILGGAVWTIIDAWLTKKGVQLK